jgi:hypothetical protein
MGIFPTTAIFPTMVTSPTVFEPEIASRGGTVEFLHRCPDPPAVPRRASILLLAVAAAHASAFASRSAAAKTGPRVEFRWDAPEGDCPTEAQVLERVEALLGGAVEASRDERLTAIARVRRESDGRWDLRLWTVTDEATRFRSIHGESCAVVAEAGALIAAMAIDPEVLSRATTDDAALRAAEDAEATADDDEPPPIEEPEPEPDSSPRAMPQPTTRPEPEPEPAPARTGAVRAGVGVDWGPLPGVGAALELRGALLLRRWRFDLVGSYLPPRRAVFDDRPDEGISAQLVAAGLRTGPSWSLGAVDLMVSLGLESGAMLGRGFGLARSERAAVLWAAVLLEPGLVWRFTRRLGLAVSVTGFVPLVRSRFTIDARGEVWRPSPVTVRAHAGLEVRLP